MANLSYIEISDALIQGLSDTSPASGLTHPYYRYPARFSPRFASAVIEAFTSQGDVVLDPFMGSGTTIVESIARGRSAIGTDVNPLAVFVARTKSTLISQRSISRIEQWWDTTLPKLNLRRKAGSQGNWREMGYQKDLPWPIRKTIELGLSELGGLPHLAERNFVRCVLLRASQWGLEARRSVPSAGSFREKIGETLREFIVGANALRERIEMRSMSRPPRSICLNGAAADLPGIVTLRNQLGAPRLVLTSPPYPGVHVLYHRWQVGGRKETPAPYWIIGSRDGKSGKFYTMGGRSMAGLDSYFHELERSFRQIREIVDSDCMVVQLVAFSESSVQLPRFLQCMEASGFREVGLVVRGKRLEATPSRNVPIRKFHAALQGRTDSSIEYLLIHQPA